MNKELRFIGMIKIGCCLQKFDHQESFSTHSEALKNNMLFLNYVYSMFVQPFAK